MFVSIVICNYNYGRFLAQAIDSGLAQTHPDTEVIVVDDGSTDDSRDVIARYQGRVTALFGSNVGQLAAYNRGFAASRGDCVIFLDADDTLEPQACQRAVGAFADTRVVKVHYRLRLIEAGGQALHELLPRRLEDGDVGWMLLREGMFYDSSPGSGNAYRRSALTRLMPLPVDHADPHAADYFLVYGVSLLGHVRALSGEPLGSYRVHTAHATSKLGFGNAGPDESKKSHARYQRLRSWLEERLGPEARLPNDFFDFGQQKQLLASSVFDSESYLAGLRSGADQLRRGVVRSIWKRRSSLYEKLGLTGWAVAVVVLPRPVGQPLALFVCNPASRKAIWRPWRRPAL